MQLNLNKALYSNELFKVWTEKKSLIPLEKYFLDKYLKNKDNKIIEAGTGGGRIIFEIENRGFSKLDAFDYVESMINFCEEKKTHLKSSVNFTTADATKLSCYKNQHFDYLIYLQQVLCFIDIKKMPLALKEAHRIGKKDSIYIFSFLNWESKFYNPILSLMVNCVRLIRGEKNSKYKLPWLNINGKFNWKFLNKDQPQNTWFKEKHILNILKNNGFAVVEIKSKVKNSEKTGHLHIACKKINEQ